MLCVLRRAPPCAAVFMLGCRTRSEARQHAWWGAGGAAVRRPRAIAAPPELQGRPVHPVHPVHPLPLPGPWELCHRINALNDCTSLLRELSVPGTLPHPGNRLGRRAALSDHAMNMPLLHVKAAQLSCCVRPFAWRVAHTRQQLVPASSKVSLTARSDEAQLLSAVYTCSIGRRAHVFFVLHDAVWCRPIAACVPGLLHVTRPAAMGARLTLPPPPCSLVLQLHKHLRLMHQQCTNDV